jgi:hypothetical protein
VRAPSAPLTTRHTRHGMAWRELAAAVESGYLGRRPPLPALPAWC